MLHLDNEAIEADISPPWIELESPAQVSYRLAKAEETN